MKVTLLLSGGMDSAVLAAHLLAHGHEVEGLSVDYGQTHRRELRQALLVANALGMHTNLVSLPALGALLPSALTRDGESKVVPNRNAILLAVAVGYAAAHKHEAVALGVNADDAADFYDCRARFLDVMARMAAANGVLLLTPFLQWPKAQVASLGRKLELDLDLTRSCYRNGEQPCGACDACRDRRTALGA